MTLPQLPTRWRLQARHTFWVRAHRQSRCNFELPWNPFWKSLTSLHFRLHNFGLETFSSDKILGRNFGCQCIADVCAWKDMYQDLGKMY